jgi:hypothetical protein
VKSVSSDALLQPLSESDALNLPACVHGTYADAWQHIARTGLSRMSRVHIHMSSQPLGSKEVISGFRSNAQILVHVDIIKAMYVFVFDKKPRVEKKKRGEMNLLLTARIIAGAPASNSICLQTAWC